MELHDRLIAACGHENGNIRRAAAIALGNMNITTAKNVLAKLMGDKFPVVKEAAISSLSKLGVTEIVDHLIALLNVEEGDVRKAVLQAVSAKGPAPQTAEQGGAFGGGGEQQTADQSWKVQKMAALALCKIKPEIAVAPLMAALDHENPNVKIASITGLGNMETEHAGDRLIEVLKDENWEVRKAAANALGKIRYKPALEPLVALLGESRFGVKIEAIIALNKFKSLDVLGPLSKTIIADNNPDVRRTAAVALGNLKSEYAIPALTKAMSDEAWQVRKATVAALAGIRSTNILQPMIEGIVDENEEVSQAAAVAYPKVVASLAAEPE